MSFNWDESIFGERRKGRSMSLFGKVVSTIGGGWKPRGCESHKDFKDNLQSYLEHKGFNVDIEYGVGHSNIDVLVNEKVGIELKRNLNNSNQKTLRGQIDDFAGSKIPTFIALICGVEDESAWRDLKKRYHRGETSNGKKLQLIRKNPSTGKTEEISPGRRR